jgi:hypothetical protein
VKHSGIEVQIGRLVVDAPRSAETAELAGAIGQALQRRLAQPSGDNVAHAGLPQAIANRIATHLPGSAPGTTPPRGKP